MRRGRSLVLRDTNTTGRSEGCGSSRTTSPSWGDQREASVYGRGRIVRVSLQTARHTERRRGIGGRPATQALGQQMRGEHDASDGRRAGRPETPLDGDAIHAVERERRQLGPSLTRHERDRARDRVGAVCRELVQPPSPSHVTRGSPRCQDLRRWPDSRARPKQSNPGPRCPEVAGTVAVRRTQVPARLPRPRDGPAPRSVAPPPAIAHSGSFRPWPVSTQTTVAPTGSVPSAWRRSRPATLARAAAGTGRHPVRHAELAIPRGRRSEPASTARCPALGGPLRGNSSRG